MLKNISKKLLWHLQGGYNPKKFWDSWSSTFMKDPWQVQTHEQHDWIVKKMKQARPKKILEVGCGFGRNIAFLIENGILPETITGTDISPKMVKLAESYIHKKQVRLLAADASSLPFEDKSFDIVLVHGVFMHIAPTSIQAAVKEVFRVTKKYLMVIEQNYEADNGYTFVHNYQDIFLKNNGKMVDHEKHKTGLDYFYVKVR